MTSLIFVHHQENSLFAQSNLITTNNTLHTMQKKKTFTTTVNDTTITASFTDLAAHANGSVLIEAGNTVVLVTVVMENNPSTKNYFPLSVEFEERFYSVGAILGSRFLRREGRPSQEATLNARIIDRTIRPLFPKSLHSEVQVIATVLSFGTYNPDTLAIIGTSLALGTSHIPWNGPVSAVRYTQTENGWKAFVPFDETKQVDNDILICGTGDRITMIEMEGREVPETDIIQVSEEATHTINHLQKFQEDVIREIGKEKVTVQEQQTPEQVKELFNEHIRPTLKEDLFSPEGGVYKIHRKWETIVREHISDSAEHYLAGVYFDDEIDALVRAEAVEHNRRVDGRGTDDVRSLYAQAGGVSPRLHGTGIFYRGETHVFTALTLGSPGDALSLNTVEDPDTDERFMHHYNFPPFSTGEVGRVGSPKRREIGHGALAEKAVRHILPSSEDFPYTMRLVSECFSSNGSTSMGSVCASTLALMDGGVPIIAPVAGIAIGLMQHNGSHKVLTDIQGPEDHYGDMDFKVAGTKNGVTAIQMDVKIEGITIEILKEALEKGRIARLTILETITGEIATPRDALSPYAPHIETITINPDTIGLVIGSGGKTIKALRADTGVENIDIEDDGTVTVSGAKENVARAMKEIYNMTRSFEVGDTLEGKVKSITDFGAFVEMSPNKDGMVHISEFSPMRVNAVEDVLAVDDVVPVVVKEVRPDGRIALSIKDRDPTFFDTLLKNQPPEQRDRRPERQGGRRHERQDRGHERRNERPNRHNRGGKPYEKRHHRGKHH